jgi:TonB family protein
MKAFVARLDYPETLRRQHVTGVVRVNVALNASGHILSAQIIKSAHPTLDAIVLRAVRQTQFSRYVRTSRLTKRCSPPLPGEKTSR